MLYLRTKVVIGRFRESVGIQDAQILPPTKSRVHRRTLALLSPKRVIIGVASSKGHFKPIKGTFISNIKCHTLPLAAAGKHSDPPKKVSGPINPPIGQSLSSESFILRSTYGTVPVEYGSSFILSHGSTLV